MSTARKIVTFRGQDYVIAGATPIRRGRFRGGRKYLLAALNPVGKAFGGWMSTRDELAASPRAASYSAEAIAEAVGRFETGMDSREKALRERKNKRVEAMVSLRPEPGMEVLVKWTNSTPTWEKVVKLSASGGVGIARRGDHDRRRPRFIAATSIVETRCAREPLPFTLGGAGKRALEAEGWVQRTSGCEFIERSYVAATSPEACRRNGRTYDVPRDRARVVFFCETSGLYWRDTGCFD